MTIVADESVDYSIVLQLRKHGLDVYSIAEKEPSITDNEVLAIAVRLHSCLITEDKDFGELVFRLQLPHHGVLLLRLFNVPTNKKGELVSKIILQHMEVWQMRFPFLMESTYESDVNGKCCLFALILKKISFIHCQLPLTIAC